MTPSDTRVTDARQGGRGRAPPSADLSAANRRRAAAVRLVIFDVDGVLTDGKLHYGSEGEAYKSFHARDGAAIKLMQERGWEVAIISGRNSQAVSHRARELGIRHVYQGVADKPAALALLCGATGVTPAQMAHVGDDQPDIELFRQVGFAVAVADASAAAVAAAHHVTRTPGGAGVASEVCELLTSAREDHAAHGQ